ncbi:MAG: ROK family protein, partial [Verrucomicrobiota bacterium]|nr:ROK family protein [Verrucomicrobiota bacterium]
MSDEYFIGVDLGGTKILAGVFDSNHNCLFTDKNKTKAELGYLGVKERIIETIKGAVHLAGIGMASVKGVGIGAPGTISADGCRVIFAPNLDWHEVPLKKDLEAELGCPVWLGNDCSIATLGIHRHELNSKSDNMVCIFLGTGIGAGIISNGVLLQGETQAAGEVGHMVLDPDGPVCGCGVSGCYEALASRTAIYNKIKKAVENGKETALVDDDKNFTKIRSGKLRRAVEAGDKLAIKVLDETCFYSGVAIANL